MFYGWVFTGRLGCFDTHACGAVTSRSFTVVQSENSILGAFNVLDTDHDGYIDSKDMERAFSGEISAKSAQRMLSNADSSGRVTFGEFKRVRLPVVTDAVHQQSHSFAPLGASFHSSHWRHVITRLPILNDRVVRRSLCTRCAVDGGDDDGG